MNIDRIQELNQVEPFNPFEYIYSSIKCAISDLIDKINSIANWVFSQISLFIETYVYRNPPLIEPLVQPVVEPDHQEFPAFAILNMVELRKQENEISRLVQSYRGLQLTDDEIESILVSESFELNSIRNALFDAKELEFDTGIDQDELPLPPLPPASKLHKQPSRVFASTNQYKVNSGAACTLLCGRYLENGLAPASRASLDRIFNENKNSTVFFLDVNTYLNEDTDSLVSAEDPWSYEGSLGCMTAYFDNYHPGRSLSDAVLAIVDNPDINGAFVVANSLTLAIKKLDNGKIELFDPHGFLTEFEQDNAYVCSFSTTKQLVQFLEKRFPNNRLNQQGLMNMSPSASVGVALTPVIQFWPISFIS